MVWFHDSIKISTVEDGGSSVMVMDDEWYVVNGLVLQGMFPSTDDGCSWPLSWINKMEWFDGAFMWWECLPSCWSPVVLVLMKMKIKNGFVQITMAEG